MKSSGSTTPLFPDRQKILGHTEKFQVVYLFLSRPFAIKNMAETLRTDTQISGHLCLREPCTEEPIANLGFFFNVVYI
jgi:hypothetical protein